MRPSERQAEPAILATEQLLHDRPPLVVGKLAQQLSRCVSHSSTEAVHALEAMCRVDRHCFIANRSARRLNNWLGRELLGFVGRGQPHLGARLGKGWNGRAATHQRKANERGRQSLHAIFSAGQYFST